MANKVKIYSALKSGKVQFDGSRVRNKEIGSLEVLAHPSLSDRIIIKSNTRFKRGSDTDYRVFFGKLNISRIQNKAGQNLVADLGMDRAAVIAYVLVQIKKPIVTEYFEYNPVTDRLEANKNIEVKKHGFFIGGKYKMASGNSNLYYEDLATKSNQYPVMGEVLDQSIAANQVAGAGYNTPKMRVFGDYQEIPLGGTPVDNTSIAYDGDNFFPFNISGVGITTRSAEVVTADQQLKYEIIINGISVYIQYLNNGSIAINEDITWYFDHPLDIESGTTLTATIYKVSTVDNQEVIDGILNVCEGDATPTRYGTTVLNRFFEDKDLELVSPYTKYQAMDFGLDSTGSTILLRDLSLGADSLLQPHAVNTLEAIADGTTIKIKVKGGAKVIVESLPVSATSIDGSFVNSVLNQAVVQLNAIFTNTAGFAGGGGNDVSTFTLSNNDLTIALDDGTSFTVDVTSLGVSTDKFVVSGAVSGSDIILTMDDATTITIDATNMINGSSGLASNSGWNISYGTNANDPVSTSTNDSTVNQQLPLYFGQALEQGSEFKWNFQSNGGSNLVIGIWDGAEVATPYNGGSITPSNWGTSFAYAGGFIDSSNSTLLTTNSGAKYVIPTNDAMGIRFDNDGHLTLIHYTGTTEVAVAKTTIALAVTSFNMQMHTWANGVLPNAIINNVDYIWDIVHDFANTEAGIINGILDHTVLESAVSIEIGEKIMFMLDEVGQGDYFGTNYTGASSGSSIAEEQLDNEFSYATNEAMSFEFGGVSDWNVNTNATNYFNNGAGIVGYREGGANTIQGMFSMRFNNDGKLTIYSEDNNEKIATAKVDPQVGSSVHLYMGVRGNRGYYSIPVISKQTISQGSQPDVNFVPTVANQTVSVTEGEVMSFQVVSSDNIVNQFVEVDAPSWMFMDQNSGILSGTAPAYLGTSADTIVVNCKAGNAVGGSVDFTVTVTVDEIVASYTNTKSLSFNGTSSLLQGNPALVTAMNRASNGDGNAWSVSMWIKPSSSTSNQTLMVYGALDDYNYGAITLKQSGGTSLVLNYGTVYDNIILVAGNALTASTWQHVMVTFNGGYTGSIPADASVYYSKFKIYVDGVLQSPIGVASNGGYSGVMTGSDPTNNIFRFGKANNVHNNYMDGIMNQMAIWDSEQSANIATIYNSGVTQDLSLLAAPPAHYYEIETGVTAITDIAGSANLTGYNFIAANLVSDTP